MANTARLILFLILIGAAALGMEVLDGGAQTPEPSHPAIEMAKVHLARGDQHCALREYDKAMAEYTRAIELNPSFAEAYNNRAFACYSKYDGIGDPLPDLDRALELRPNFPHAYNTRGCVYLSRGDVEKAIADFNQAIALRPEYPRAYNNRANAHLRQGQFRLAIADFERAGKNPKRILTYLGIIVILVAALTVAAVYGLRKTQI